MDTNGERQEKVTQETHMQPSRRPRIIFCEDEAFLRQEFAKFLQAEDYDILSTGDPDEALAWMREHPRIDLLLTDVQMALGPATAFSQMATQGGRCAGVALARRFRRLFPTAPVILWSALYDSNIRTEVRKLGNAELISKRQDGQAVLDCIVDMLEGIDSGRRPRIFIVHGHDETLRAELMQMLVGDREEGEFGLPEPIVLREQASGTRTLIEKIEDEALNVDFVFVLLTPDDRVLSEDGTQIQTRARQNVIFELGYFMGMLGRAQGRIIILYTRDVELPSNIEGILKIDVTKGLASARGEIRRELAEWLPN